MRQITPRMLKFDTRSKVILKMRFWGTFQNANVCPFALGLGSWELYGYIKNR